MGNNKINVCIAIMLLGGAAAMPAFSIAADMPGVRFVEDDWELACDNTGTCRAAGYQSDGEEPAVSLLLVRSAGQRQEVTAQVKLGSYSEDDSAMSDGVEELTVMVDGRAVGKVKMDPGSDAGTLSPGALAAIVPALLASSAVAWSSGKHAWNLSAAGANAVLSKMDSVQGRGGTTGTIVNKGSKAEDGVLQATPAPIVVAAPVPQEGVTLEPAQRTALLKDLRRLSSAEECEAELDVHRLSRSKLVASLACDAGAYNQSRMYWVINATVPFAPVIAGENANDYDDGEISSFQKLRGLGDCGTSTVWTWNGAQFVKTSESSTGMCRLVTQGGTWGLPTYLATVRKQSARSMKP